MHHKHILCTAAASFSSNSLMIKHQQTLSNNTHTTTVQQNKSNQQHTTHSPCQYREDHTRSNWACCHPLRWREDERAFLRCPRRLRGSGADISRPRECRTTFWWRHRWWGICVWLPLLSGCCELRGEKRRGRQQQ